MFQVPEPPASRSMPGRPANTGLKYNDSTPRISHVCCNQSTPLPPRSEIGMEDCCHCDCPKGAEGPTAQCLRDGTCSKSHSRNRKCSSMLPASGPRDSRYMPPSLQRKHLPEGIRWHL